MFKRFRMLALNLLLALMLSTAAFAATAEEIAAEGTCGDNLTWTLTNGGVLTIEGFGPMADYGFLDTPWDETGCPEVTQVVLPDGLTAIGDYAFSSCGQLESITLPYGLTRIGDSAFQFCYALTSVEIPNTVTEIGTYAFRQCQALASVTLPNKLTQIPHAAFMDSGIEYIDIPSSVTTIAYQAFYNCDALKEITIPENVTEIGGLAFARCSSLQAIQVDQDNQSYTNDWQGVLFDAGMTTLIQYPLGRSNAGYIIPDGVQEVGEEAFYSSENLTKVTIPDGVTRLYEQAFGACANLATVTIPGSMQTMDTFAFGECPNLVKVTVEEGVTNLGSDTFAYCPRLHTVILPSTVTAVYSSPFYECSTLRHILFMGDALSYAGEAGTSYASFPDYTTLCYFSGSKGWTSPTWKGYKTTLLMGADRADFHDGSYYNNLRNYFFRFVDNGQTSISGVTVTAGGDAVSSGSASSIDVALSRSVDQITFSKAGYYSVTLPVAVLGSINRIMLYPTSYTEPFVQAAYAREAGTYDFHDLLYSGMTFYSGSLDDETQFYIDINWAGSTPGSCYLSQTFDPADGDQLQEGLNDPLNVSTSLEVGSNLYLLMKKTDETREYAKLKATILKKQIEVPVDSGGDVDVPKPADDGFMSNFSSDFSVNLFDDVKLSLSVDRDGTVKGLIGVTVAEEENKYMQSVFESVEEELLAAKAKENNETMKDVRNLINRLKKRDFMAFAPPKSSSFLVKMEVEVLGCFTGKIMEDADGNRTLDFKNIMIGTAFDGSARQIWQIYPGGVPIYIEGSLGLEAETVIPLIGEDGSKLFVDPMELKVVIEILARAGLGFDSIASVGVYGKGEGTLKTLLPIDPDKVSYCSNASFGLEAEIFCLKIDHELWKTKDYYLIGGPDEETAAAMLSLALADDSSWQSQSRDYLYAVSPFSVGEEETEISGETLFESVYPYADVQMAQLEDGTRILVWTADDGSRDEDNNRTILYYSYHNGTGWSTPAPVRSSDDGKADFNPVLKVICGKACLLWQNASRALTADDTLSTTAKAMNLAYAEFNPNNGTFRSFKDISTTSYDGAMSLTEVDGYPAIVWVSNAADNPFLCEGETCSLYRVVYGIKGWGSKELLASNLGYIDQTAADGNKIYFSMDTDASGATIQDREIFCYDASDGSMTQLTDNDVADTKAAFHGKLTWYADGSIATMADTIPLQGENDRYQYLKSASGLEAVVSVSTDSQRVSSLWATFNDGTGWGEPVLLDGGNGNIGSFSAVFAADGTLRVSVSERSVGEDYTLGAAAKVREYTVTTLCDLSFEDVSYLPHSLVADGTLDIQADIRNCGASAVELINFTVYDGGTALWEGVYYLPLRSGESGTVMLAVPLDQTLPENLSVEVSAVGFEDADEADNTADLALRLSDLSLESAHAWSDSTSTQVVVFAANRGQTALEGFTLELLDGDGAVIASRENFSLAKDESEFVTFELDAPYEQNTILTVNALAPEGLEENLQANNDALALVNTVAESIEPTLSVSYTKTDSGINVITELKNPPASAGCTIYCTVYDGDGKLLAADIQNCDTSVSGVISNQFLLQSELPQSGTIRVFLLQEDLMPLIEATVEQF